MYKVKKVFNNFNVNGSATSYTRFFLIYTVLDYVEYVARCDRICLKPSF